MKIIPVTPTVKRRVATMIKNIFPKVGYVRVAHSGLVTLKTKWYSLKRTRIPITDLMLHSIPNRISEIAEKRGFGVGYKVIFNTALNAMFQLISTNDHWDILEYVWDQYNKYCVVPISPSKISLTEPIRSRNNFIPCVSIGSLYGFEKLIKQINKQKDKYEVEVIEVIKRRMNNLPRIHLSSLTHLFNPQYSY